MTVAYVTFVMRNDAFIPGALTFAYALKAQGIQDDVIVMLSQHVSEAAEAACAGVFDRVIRFEEIHSTHRAGHERQDRRFLFSRFAALRLGHDGDLGKGYDKIVLCDADLLPLKDFANLKALKAPAGILNEFKEHALSVDGKRYVYPPSIQDKGTWIWHEVYHEALHGEKIPKAWTDRPLHDTNNMGMNASIFVLRPSRSLLDSIEHDLSDPVWIESIEQFPWPEMQYLTVKLSGQWHNLDIRYSSFNGYPGMAYVNGIHFAGLKPWQIKHRSIEHFAGYDDFQLYYEVFLRMMKAVPQLSEFKALERLKQFALKQRQPSKHCDFSSVSWLD
jgi:glycogenin glucosyltransferase